ncbi:12999_t:CDS:2 [Gigaspora margarita]|uniref:12999_t:CDS:1 n=1 Tax=Gigaspora margarita TaxID=4874 RepID=A0ABN7UB00_GIGMA|nr:12999_t:CDS:2 [Gigaspora margarita]
MKLLHFLLNFLPRHNRRLHILEVVLSIIALSEIYDHIKVQGQQ